MKKIIFIFLLFALNLPAEEAYLEPLDMIVEYYRSGYIDDNELREVQKLYDQVKKRKDTKYYMASKKHLSAIENDIIMQVNGLIDQEVGYDLENMNETYKIYKADGSLFPENELGKPRENHPAVKYDYPPVIKNYLESTKAKKKNEYYKNEINQILDELNYWLWYYSPMNPDAVLPETQNFRGSLSRSEVDAINYRVEVDGSLMYIFPDLATKGIDYLYKNVKFMKKSSKGWALNTLLNTTIYVIEVNQIEDISVGMIKSVGFASYVKGAAFKVQVEFDKISKNLIERTQLAGGDYFGAKYKRGQMIPPDKSLIQQIAKNTIALYYIGDIAQYDEAADKIEKLFCMLVCKLQNIYKDFEFKWDEENSLFPNSILSPRNYTKPSFSVYNKIPKNTKANLSICEKTKNIEFPKSKQEPEQLEEKGTPEQPIGGGTPEKPEQPKEKNKPGTTNAKNWWDDLHKFVKWEGSFKNDVLFLLIFTGV